MTQRKATPSRVKPPRGASRAPSGAAPRKTASSAPIASTPGGPGARRTTPAAEEVRRRTSEWALRPTIQAAFTLTEVNKGFGDLDIAAVIDELGRQVEAVGGGDLTRAEGILVAQVHTLDGLFNILTRKVALNMGSYLDAAERYLRLALKAQSQCRTTLETLAVLKNPPPVAFVRQAIIAHGPQQVNNAPSDPRAREVSIPASSAKSVGDLRLG